MMELYIYCCIFMLCCIGVVAVTSKPKPKPKESPGIIAALEHDCDLLAASCKKLQFKNDELLLRRLPLVPAIR